MINARLEGALVGSGGRVRLRRRSRLWRKVTRNRVLVVACAIYVVCAVVASILAPWIAPYDPNLPFGNAVMQGPSALHWLGTDQIGRDELSRVIWGGRVTVLTGVLSCVIGLGLGTMIGLLAGYVGSWVDNLLMRLVDISLAVPGIVLALAIVAILGPSLINATYAIGIGTAPVVARVVRGSVLAVKSSDFIQASKIAGAGNVRIMLRHVLPSIRSTIVVFGTLMLGGCVLDIAGLSFIGLGAQPPTPEWGTMLSEAQGYLSQAWWTAVFPGLAITMLVFSVNVLGDGLRDLLESTG